MRTMWLEAAIWFHAIGKAPEMLRLLFACFSLACSLSAGVVPGAGDDAALGRAIQFFDAKQYEESRPLLKQVLATHPDNATAHYYLGRIYLDEGDADNAVAHCKTSVEISAEVAEHHFCLGRSYGEKARRAPFWMQVILAPKIRQAFETTVALDPSHRSARVGLTHFYMRAPAIMGGSLAKAEEQAEQLIRLDDPRGEALLQEIRKRRDKEPSTN